MRLVTGKKQNESNKIQIPFMQILVFLPLEVPFSPYTVRRFKLLLSFLIKVEITSQGAGTLQELQNSKWHCKGWVPRCDALQRGLGKAQPAQITATGVWLQTPPTPQLPNCHSPSSSLCGSGQG